jgi:hypothetical protein
VQNFSLSAPHLRKFGHITIIHHRLLTLCWSCWLIFCASSEPNFKIAATCATCIQFKSSTLGEYVAHTQRSTKISDPTTNLDKVLIEATWQARCNREAFQKERVASLLSLRRSVRTLKFESEPTIRRRVFACVESI